MTVADKDLVLGYDFGTSAVKAALFGRDGSIIARASASYPLILPAPGWAEQAPGDWWNAMAEATRRLTETAGADPERIAAIGVAATMCGVVPTDADGRALGNCLMWLDTRSAALARRAFGGRVRLAGYGIFKLWRWMRLTGGAPNLSGRDPITKMMWLRENRPEEWRRIHKLLDAKDYIVRRLTGRFVTSFDVAHLTWLFDARAGRKRWSENLLRRTGLNAGLLPEIAGATQNADPLAADAAAALGLRAGTPVAAGLGDVAAAAFASGALAQGAPHLNVGTSAWFGAHLIKSRVDPLAGIGSISRADGRGYLLIAAQENAGACVDWAMRALDFAPGDYSAFDAAARKAALRADAPLFLPWLYGERVPVQDERVRAGFLGLAADSGRPEMARAVLEGVALNMRWAVNGFDRLAGSAGSEVRLVGGGGNSELWCQILADVLQRPIAVMDAADLGGARGSAMVASVTAGWHANVEAAASMTRIARIHTPDPARAAYYKERFALFVGAYRRLGPWYRRFRSA